MNLIIGIIAMVIDKLLGLNFGINTIYNLVVFLPGLAVAVRRLHDIGKSGWLLLLFYVVMIASTIVMIFSGILGIVGGASLSSFGIGLIVPLLGILAFSIWLLVLFCTEGNHGENKYGADPKAIE